MSSEIINVEFECENENCTGILTLGIVGGIESLNGDMPPSCLYCGDPRPLKEVNRDDNSKS